MDKVGELVVALTVDTTELNEQMEALESLLQTAAKTGSHDFYSSLLRNLPAVLNDVIFADTPPAGGAGLDTIHCVRLGTKYERFTAAIRAGKLDVDFL